ncbi:MAG: restriction endonuclease subunit S [Spirochaetaceae bacterium]|nr:restriction endonuclease subunit S [Spirochaetaceae bacterium]
MVKEGVKQVGKEQWQKVCLGEVMRFQNGKKRPNKKGQHPVYGGNGIFDYTNNYNYENVNIIGRVGAYCGNVYFEPNKSWVSDNAIAAINLKNSDIQFDYYLLKNLRLNKRHIGTSQPLLTQEILNTISVIIPPLPTQRDISNILSCLDDKIELNRRINANLEAQSQAIFKNWFVDFAPFKDGVFIDSELGRIPECCRVGRLGEIADITSGKRPSYQRAAASDEAKIPLIGASSIMGYTNNILYNGRILITGRVGTHGIIQRYARPCWPSDNTLVIKSNFYEFTYQQLRGINFRNINRGSTQPLITQTDLKNVPIILPSEIICFEFEKTTSSLMEQLERNVLESECLASIRDTLLPKLMNGEIEVKAE